MPHRSCLFILPGRQATRCCLLVCLPFDNRQVIHLRSLPAQRPLYYSLASQLRKVHLPTANTMVNTDMGLPTSSYAWIVEGALLNILFRLHIDLFFASSVT